MTDIVAHCIRSARAARLGELDRLLDEYDIAVHNAAEDLVLLRFPRIDRDTYKYEELVDIEMRRLNVAMVRSRLEPVDLLELASLGWIGAHELARERASRALPVEP